MPPVTRLTRLGLVNCYLVREDDGLTLIDTTVSGVAKKVLTAAQGMGAPVRRIVLTHAHGDHVGSVDELVERLPGVELITSERERRLLAKDMSLDPGEPRDKLRGGYPGARSEPARVVRDGDRIGSLEVIATPGHTPGHISLLDERDGTLYCGDVFSTLGGTATSASFSLPLPLSLFTWHHPTVLESARRLSAREPSRLAPGHGRVLESPAPAMERAIERSAAAV